MILYECGGKDLSGFTPEQLKGAPCEQTTLGSCRSGSIVAAWAVGGQVCVCVCVCVCVVCVNVFKIACILTFKPKCGYMIILCIKPLILPT